MKLLLKVNISACIHSHFGRGDRQCEKREKQAFVSDRQ